VSCPSGVLKWIWWEAY